MALELRPITLRRANEFVAALHRHHRPVAGCLFCQSVWTEDTLHGVAIVGRPTARMADDGLTCEVTRVCTDGARNACSMLYGACARIARSMGFHRIQTYTLPEEGGASLRAAGWTLESEFAGGGTWSRVGRERTDVHPTQQKARWARQLALATPSEEQGDER